MSCIDLSFAQQYGTPFVEVAAVAGDVGAGGSVATLPCFEPDLHSSATLAKSAPSLLCVCVRRRCSQALPSEIAQVRLAYDTDRCLPRCW